MIGNFHGQMSISKKICSLLIPALILSLLSPSVHGRELEIRQENYMFNMPITQSMISQTFIINKLSKLDFEEVVDDTCLVVTYFPFAESILSPAQKKIYPQ